jgi:hypothetical protein
MKSVIGVLVFAPYFLVLPLNKALGGRMFIKFWHHFGVLEWAIGRKAFDHE